MARLAFTNARLIDGERPPVDGTTVVVDGDRIAEITQGAPAAPVEETYDLAGRTLMPGMFTCHFHATYHELGSKPNVPYGDEYPPSYLAMIAARNFQTALGHGYTGVVGAGGSHEVEPGVKRAIDDGMIPGPRVWASSRELSTTGHSNDGVPWHWGMPAPGAVRLCDGADSFRLGVREEIKRGADVIKLFVTGGHGTTAPKDQMELTEAELAAAIEAAHQRGKLIRGHLVNKRAIMLAIELGIDIVDHCDEMDDEVIAALVDRGTFVTPSLHFPKHFLEAFGSGLGFAADAIRADLDHMYETIPKAQAAGVRFLLGDDYGAIGFGHGMYGGELRLYVEHAGVSPLDVIGWGTRNGAALVGRDADLGTVAVGKLADLLVVDGDPSTDIGALADHRPVAVLKGGAVVAGSLDELRRTPRAIGIAVAHAHAAAEGVGDLGTTMATLVDEPVYELQPMGVAFRGADAARDYYDHFFSTFQPLISGFSLLSEWVTDEGVGQEYELVVNGPDGPVAHHIIGILVFGDDGKLAGERLYASDELFRVMVGPVLDRAEPLPRLPSRA